MSDAFDRPLKIIGVIARLNIGGPARHVLVIDSGMRARGHETLLAYGQVNADEASMAPLAQEQHVRAVEVPHLGRSLRPLRDAQAFIRLVALLFAERPDVCLLYTSPSPRD